MFICVHRLNVGPGPRGNKRDDLGVAFRFTQIIGRTRGDADEVRVWRTLCVRMLMQVGVTRIWKSEVRRMHLKDLACVEPPAKLMEVSASQR